MIEIAPIARLLVEIACGVNLGFTTTLLFGLWRLSRRPSPPVAAPPLCILRPCEGDEPGLLDNLLSSLTVEYPAPRRVLFLVPDERDPAHAVAQAVCSRAGGEVAAQVLVTSPRPLENRKVAQLIAGLAHSNEEIVVCADSDVRLVPGDLEALLGSLLNETARPVAGAAFAAPIEVAPRTVWDRASTAVVGGSPQSFLALYGLSALFGGAPNMAGALCAYRRQALSAIGGLAGVRDCLGEDNELARRLSAAGYGVALSPRPARCFDAGRDAAAAIARVARWLTVVRAQRPQLFLSYPLLVAATPIFIVLAGLVRSPVLVAFTAVLLLLRIVLSVALRRFFGLRRGPLSALIDVLCGESLLLVGFVRAVLSRRIQWRGHPFVVERGGRLRPVTPPS